MKNKTNLKILFLSHISELVGGAERSMLDVADVWVKEFNIYPEFILRNPIGSLAEELDKRGWKHHDLDYTFWSHSTLPNTPESIYSQSTQNSKAIIEIEKIIKKTKPDIVMTNTIVAPWAALAAYYQRLPHVWFIREYGDLDHGRVFELGREKTFEDIDDLSDLVATNSRTLAKYVKKYVNPKKVTTVYTPFNLDLIDKKLSKKVENPFRFEDSLKLVIIGNITESKGHLEIVRAMSILKNQGKKTELCVVGSEGPIEYKKLLQKFIKENKLSESVHFVGNQNNPFPYIAHSDIGLMASRMEAFGRVTYEYLASSKPVVGANSGATPEMVINNQTGYLYKAGDYNDLSNKLSQYFDNRTLLVKHGKNARNLAESMIGDKFGAEALYKKVLKAIDDHPKNITKPINFTHRILEYQDIAANNVLSVKKLAVTRVKQRLKKPYKKIRDLTNRNKK